MKVIGATVFFTLTACATPGPGVEVRVVEVVREVQRPCPATPPQRPTPLGPLPADAVAALAHVMAKLGEYSLPGRYADQAEAYVAACPPSE